MAIYQTIVVEKKMPYYLITLNRLQKKNSLDVMMLQELHQALDQIEEDTQIHLLIIKGQEGFFCTGMDFTSVDETQLHGSDSYMKLLHRFATIPRIIISCVEGVVIGGGMGIIAASDLVAATLNSRFSLPEAIWGLLPACVAPYLMRRIGYQATFRLTLTTQTINADEAYRLQLIDELSDDPMKSIHPHILRISRIDLRTIQELKNYYTKLWPISAETEAFAVNKIKKLIQTPWIKQKILDSNYEQLSHESISGEKIMTKKRRAWLALKNSVQQILPDISDSMLQPQNNLQDLGANSMDRADIIISTLEILQLKIPPGHFVTAKTLDELTDLFAMHLSE